MGKSSRSKNLYKVGTTDGLSDSKFFLDNEGRLRKINVINIDSIESFVAVEYKYIQEYLTHQVEYQMRHSNKEKLEIDLSAEAYDKIKITLVNLTDLVENYLDEKIPFFCDLFAGIEEVCACFILQAQQNLFPVKKLTLKKERKFESSRPYFFTLCLLKTYKEMNELKGFKTFKMDVLKSVNALHDTAFSKMIIAKRLYSLFFDKLRLIQDGTVSGDVKKFKNEIIKFQEIGDYTKSEVQFNPLVYYYLIIITSNLEVVRKTFFIKNADSHEKYPFTEETIKNISHYMLNYPNFTVKKLESYQKSNLIDKTIIFNNQQELEILWFIIILFNLAYSNNPKLILETIELPYTFIVFMATYVKTASLKELKKLILGELKTTDVYTTIHFDDGTPLTLYYSDLKKYKINFIENGEWNFISRSKWNDLRKSLIKDKVLPSKFSNPCLFTLLHIMSDHYDHIKFNRIITNNYTYFTKENNGQDGYYLRALTNETAVDNVCKNLVRFFDPIKYNYERVSDELESIFCLNSCSFLDKMLANHDKNNFELREKLEKFRSKHCWRIE